jgi:hypothetical protein
VFTRRNLYFAVRRARGEAMTEGRFEAALRRRLLRGPLPGLLPAPSKRRPSRPASGGDAGFPEAVLMVDRPAVLGLFLALGLPGFAVVCLDGSPAAVVDRLARGFREGQRAAVLYLHDAATVVYPFAVEPLATLVRHREGGPMVFRDLGLPPLGASPRRFAAPSLPGDEAIFELEAIPPAALARYVERARSAAVPAAEERRDVDPPVLVTAPEGQRGGRVE